MYTIDGIVCYLFTTARGKVLMVTEEIKNQLRAVVGKEYVLDSEIDRFGYSSILHSSPSPTRISQKWWFARQPPKKSPPS